MNSFGEWKIEAWDDIDQDVQWDVDMTEFGLKEKPLKQKDEHDFEYDLGKVKKIRNKVDYF